MNEWIDKMWYLPRVEPYLFLERNEHSMNLGDIIPNEISQLHTKGQRRYLKVHEVPRGFKITDRNQCGEGREGGTGGY